MNFKEQIQKLRKERGMTQNELAEKLFISYQAVSQWENGNTKPDIELLPKLAEIFDVSIDELFGRREIKLNYSNVKDDTVYFVVARGSEIIGTMEYDTLKNKKNDINVTIEGDLLRVESSCSVTVKGNVSGGVNANCDVNCNDISGGVRAACDINCATISGGASAGCDINCATISGGANIGNDLNCANISGDITVGGDITCDKIEAEFVKAEGIIYCSDKIDAGKVEITEQVIDDKKTKSKIVINM